jgi:hypothetical protein
MPMPIRIRIRIRLTIQVTVAHLICGSLHNIFPGPFPNFDG